MAPRSGRCRPCRSTRARSRPAICTSPSAGRGSTGMPSLPRPSRSGAAGVVVSDPAAVTATDLPVIVVEDTLRGLQEAARVIRRRAGSTVVAITGSAGKTTTKEITATLLGRRFTTFRNRGNLNNHIGLPLSLFELHTAPQFAVMELGHERRRRDQPARVDRRTAGARLDQRRRGAPRLLRVGRRDRAGQAGDPRGRRQPTTCSSPTPATHASSRGPQALPARSSRSASALPPT